ncbi:hypothetical protein BH11PSE12_BH11PSE12_15250 [soil metagenome]
MAASDFFMRWSKLNVNGASEGATTIQTDDVSPSVPVTSPTSPTTPAPVIPVMEDVAQLQDDSDFSVFMNHEVDEAVRRSAMKKLFSQPHFNVMDGLDIYIGDYSQADPLPPGMLAQLRHAESLLDPLRHLERPVLSLREAGAGEVLPEGQNESLPLPSNEIGSEIISDTDSVTMTPCRVEELGADAADNAGNTGITGNEGTLPRINSTSVVESNAVVPPI